MSTPVTFRIGPPWLPAEHDVERHKRIAKARAVYGDDRVRITDVDDVTGPDVEVHDDGSASVTYTVALTP